MRVLFINLSLMYRVEGEYYSKESWNLFPIKLARHIERITLLGPVQVCQENGPLLLRGKWKLNPGNLRIAEFDPCNSYARYFKSWFGRGWDRRKIISRLVEDHDVVIVRAPSPVTFMVTKIAKRKKKKLVFIFAGNMETSSDRVLGNHGLMRVFYRGIIKLIKYLERSYVKNSDLIYIYTNELLDEFGKNNPRVRFTQDPLLSLDDFVHREDTCQGKEIRILQVCRLIPVKGTEYLLQAMALLLSKGFCLRLEIAGEEKAGSGYQSKLEKLSEGLGIREKVHFAGWVPYDQIQKVYLRSDIQVIASLSEGVPRCIAEGAGRGVPLVSTTAGGCASVLTDEKNALLVSPGDPNFLAAGIERIIKDDNLRRKLIQNGYELARNSSFEVLGKWFLNDIDQVVSSK